MGMLLAFFGVFVSLGSTAQAESSTSTSYNLDYARFTNDSDQKTSSSYQLTDSISDISADGSSASYLLRNVYPDTVSASGAVCGNGLIETGEQCEGSNFNGLTCSNYGYNSGSLSCVNCAIVPACFNTGGGGGGSSSVCGNNIREATEQCDDGNTNSGDGCNAYCRIEVSVCGNGILNLGEQCDDGNTNAGDGCTSLCLLEDPETPEEPEEPETPETPEEPEAPEEPELVFDPDFELDFEFPVEEELEVAYVAPVPQPLRPSATEVSESISKNSFHFEQYALTGKITVLDETPFIVTEAEPDSHYEMLSWDSEDNLITRQGAISDSNGVLMVELVRLHGFTTHRVEMRNAAHETLKVWDMAIEDRKYLMHDNLFVNGERSLEYIALGSYKAGMELVGEGKPNTKYHAYIQRVMEHDGTVPEIIYVTTEANDEGIYALQLPKDLENASYTVNMVQVYDDKKVSRNKRYIFEVNNTEKKLFIWVPLMIALIAIAGYGMGQSKPRRKHFSLRTLSLAFALTIMAQAGVAQAAVTTPTVFVYEGKLLDASNDPITTSQTFRFSLWSSDDHLGTDILGSGAIDVTAPAYGGWQETHTLTPNTDGTFFIELGSGTALPDMVIGTHDHLMVEIKTAAALDTAYELMDPTGDSGADTNDRQTLGSVPYTNNADFIDNAELGTTSGDIVALGAGDVWDVTYIPDATNADSWTVDDDNTVGAGGHINITFGDTIAETLGWDVDNTWFEFSDDVSFNQNEIKDVALDNLAAAPGAPVAGQIYHNTTDGNTYIWNGVAWEDITASGNPDLDDVYTNDADKVMDVDNASGLEFESTTAGNVIVDLQSTGDFEIQDAGSPFAIFTDGGSFSIGNTTSPLSVFHVDSNAANTTAIATFENTAGDLQFFRSDATPEGAVTGSIGDIAIDGTNGNAYIKNSGTSTSTGWIQVGGSEAKTEIFHAEYEDSTINGDGTSNKGILSSHFADDGGTDKYNYYEWTTREATIQDVDIHISFRLPEDFQSFTASPLSLLYRTSDGVTATNQIDVEMYDTAGAAVVLTGGTDLASATWATAGITFGGGETFTAGDVITLVIRPHSTSSGYARVSDLIFNYNGS